MPDALFLWLMMLAVAAGALWTGLRFRRGKSSRMLPLYRRVGLPAIYRNLPLGAPLLGAGLLVLSLLSAPLILRFNLGLELPGRAVGALWLIGGGLALGAFGAFLLVLSRPPQWLVPTWLRTENERIGERPPQITWLDKIAVGWAVLNVGIGGAMLLGALVLGVWGK